MSRRLFGVYGSQAFDSVVAGALVAWIHLSKMGRPHLGAKAYHPEVEVRCFLASKFSLPAH
jgi:hypothetical protein